jgi:glucose-6-phosphate 1-epimerase
VNNTEFVLDGPCTAKTLTGPDGAQLTVCEYGGHVLGWTPAGGVPRLWLSPAAACGNGKAIRGGIPVIWPQFSGRGSLPKHGFARDRDWSGSSSFSDGESVTWEAVLSDSEETRALYPHRFEIRLTARAQGNRLDTTLTVTNRGGAPLSFTGALHTYLAVGGSGAVVSGFDGFTAQDNGTGATVPLTGELSALDERDVAIAGATGPVVLRDPELGDLTITADGFPDRVVWNPGPRHNLGDVPQGAERYFVCVEPAALESIVVNSTNVWNGRQTLVADGLETHE